MPALEHAEIASVNESGIEAETSFNENVTTTIPVGEEEPVASFDQYLMSIVFMPHSLRMVCLTNLFCWMAHVRYNSKIFFKWQLYDSISLCYLREEFSFAPVFRDIGVLFIVFHGFRW